MCSIAGVEYGLSLQTTEQACGRVLKKKRCSQAPGQQRVHDDSKDGATQGSERYRRWYGTLLVPISQHKATPSLLCCATVQQALSILRLSDRHGNPNGNRWPRQHESDCIQYPTHPSNLFGCRLQQNQRTMGKRLTHDLDFDEMTVPRGGTVCPHVPVHDTRTPQRSHR